MCQRIIRVRKILVHSDFRSHLRIALLWQFHFLPSYFCATLATLLVAGCSIWGDLEEQSSSFLLPPVQSSQDSVTIEIFSTWFPCDDNQLNLHLWKEIDEQQLPSPERQELNKNGFRVGVVGKNLPTSLARLLEVNHNTPVAEGSPRVVKSEVALKIRRQLLHIPRNTRAEIVASDIHRHLPILLYEDGRVRGNSFNNAQCILALKPSLHRDGGIELEVVPELHHGSPRRTYNGTDGMFLVEISKPKQIFENLRFQSALSSGQMLILSSIG